MKRLLFRLLLIVSFVMNGAAAPWVSAAEAEAAPVAMEDCHHAEEAPDTGADEAACCEGPGCQCGCLLTPMVAWRFAPGARPAWSAAPHTEPATRPAARRSAPPFRPPAA